MRCVNGCVVIDRWGWVYDVTFLDGEPHRALVYYDFIGSASGATPWQWCVLADIYSISQSNKKDGFTTNHPGGLRWFQGLFFVFVSAYDVDTYEMYFVVLLLCKNTSPRAAPRGQRHVQCTYVIIRCHEPPYNFRLLPYAFQDD